MRVGAVALVLLTIAFVGCVYVGVLPLESRGLIFQMRGPKVVLAAAALFLLGAAWAEATRAFSPRFLQVLAGVAGFMLLIESSGPLFWRSRTAAWTRVPDDQSCLTQSTAWSCGPAAAAMLLHLHGLAASEGEMAYLSRTSLFGTDGFALAQAVDARAEGRGWRAVFARFAHDDCLAVGRPFIATMRSMEVFAHAVVVADVNGDEVTIIDPGNGQRKRVARAL